MNQPDEPKKNVALGASSRKPAQSFRKGAIQASIWLRRSTDDYSWELDREPRDDLDGGGCYLDPDW